MKTKEQIVKGFLFTQNIETEEIEAKKEKIYSTYLKGQDKGKFEDLLSKERLASYENSPYVHFFNLKMITNATSKIATLEIILRNKLDSVLSLKDNEWIRNAKDNKIIEAREKIEKNNDGEYLSHHQYLSRLSLGIIIRTIKQEKLQNQVMSLKNIKFKEYDSNNRDFKQNKKKSRLRNFEKVDIALNLLQNLRNRSYHWENLLKVRVTNTFPPITYPRLTTKIHNVQIGIHPFKIERFLSDLIKIYDEEILDYCYYV